MLDGRDPGRFERELNRFALAYGTIAAVNGAFLTPWNNPRDLPDAAPLTQAPTIQVHQVELPVVNAAQLSVEQRTAWNEAKDRFRNVASRSTTRTCY